MSRALHLRTLDEARAWALSKGPIIVVAPTRRAADAFARSLAEERPLLGVRRRSVDQLALELSLGPEPNTSLGARRSVVTHLCSGPLEYFGEVARTPGFASAMTRTLDELRRFGVEPQDLHPTDPRQRDLASLLRGYLAARRERGFRDTTDAMTEADQPSDPVLFLDVIPEDPTTAAFLERVAVEGSAAFVPEHDAPGCAWWFGGAFAERPPEVSFPAGAEVMATPDAFCEASEVARWLVARAREGVPFDRMAVVLRHPGMQQGELQSALDRADLPAFFTRGTRRPHAGGRALLSLLACAEDGLSARLFAEYLSFGQVPDLDPSGASVQTEVPWVAPRDDRQLVFASLEPAPPSTDRRPPSADGPVSEGSFEGARRWERWLVEAAVVGGADRWRRRVRGLAREFERAAERALDEADRDAHAASARCVRRLEAFALPLIEEMASWGPATWGVWLDRLAQLCGSALREPEPVLAALAELNPLRALGPVELAEVRSVISGDLVDLRDASSAEPYGRIFVCTPVEAAGRSFDAVVVPGVVEGRFPEALREDPLLPDETRAQLREGLAQVPRTRVQERRAMRRALGAASGRALVMVPRLAQLDGGQQIPSQYVSELLGPSVQDAPRPERRTFGQGWHLPVDRADAIDATEYDLSVLADATPGAARYLRTGGIQDTPVNPHLDRALVARFFRWRKRAPVTPKDGCLASADSPEARWIDARRPSARPKSATGLQAFAACPYQYFLRVVLGFRLDIEELEPELLHPVTRGSLHHEILFALHQSTDGSLDAMAAALPEVARSIGTRFEEELCPAIPAVFWRTVGSIERDIRGWIRVRRREGAREGLAAELAFGLGASREGRDPASIDDPVIIFGMYPVRGSVDRLERDPSGFLRVVDFKTGRFPKSLGDLGGGRVLQPALYAQAVESLMKEPVEEGVLDFATERAGHRRHVVRTTERSTLEALGYVFDVIEQAHREGDFRAHPGPGDCRFCDFASTLCGRREEERTRLRYRPDEPAAERLAKLRGLP